MHSAAPASPLSHDKQRGPHRMDLQQADLSHSSANAPSALRHGTVSGISAVLQRDFVNHAGRS
jgi:hypothetical protein